MVPRSPPRHKAFLPVCQWFRDGHSFMIEAPRSGDRWSRGRLTSRRSIPSGASPSTPTVSALSSTLPTRTRNRVLVVAPQPFFIERGTPIAVRHVIESLSDLGYDVDVLTFPGGQSPDIRNVRYFRVRNLLGFKEVPIGFSLRKVWLDLFLWSRLRRLLQTEEYGVVFGVEEAGFMTVLSARRHGVPVVYDMQSSMPEQLREHWLFGLAPLQTLLVQAERWLVRSADRVACSSGLENRVHNVVPAAEVLSWTFPGTVGGAATHLRTQVRAELGIADDQPMVVYTGNFAEYQGVPDLVDAMQIVQRSHPRAVLVLVGMTPADRDGVVADKVSRMSPGAFRLVPRQPPDRMAGYLAAADVAASPRTLGGNVPLKVFEYLTAGLAIVATRIPAHTAVLDDRVALLVDAGPAGLAAGIVRLLDDVALRSEFEARAREFATDNLSQGAFRLAIARLVDSLRGVGEER